MDDKRSIEGLDGLNIHPTTKYEIIPEGFAVQFNLEGSLTHLFKTASDELMIEIMRFIQGRKCQTYAVYNLEQSIVKCIDNRQIELDLLSTLLGYPMDFIQTRTGGAFGLLKMVLRTAGKDPKYKYFPHLYPQTISVVFNEVIFSNVYAYYIKINYKPIYPLIFRLSHAGKPLDVKPDKTKDSLLLFDRADSIGTNHGALVSTILQRHEWVKLTGSDRKAFLEKMQSHLFTPEEG